MSVLLSGNSLGKPITDATALPEDVVSGKVFYNNDGKQIGSFPGMIHSVTKSFDRIYATSAPVVEYVTVGNYVYFHHQDDQCIINEFSANPVSSYYTKQIERYQDYSLIETDSTVHQLVGIVAYTRYARFSPNSMPCHCSIYNPNNTSGRSSFILRVIDGSLYYSLTYVTTGLHSSVYATIYYY